MIDLTMFENREMSEIYINQFEVVTEETGKGYGKTCMELLMEKYPNIHKIDGIAYEGSERFWLGLGADFCDTCENCPISGTVDCPLLSYEEVFDEYSENEFTITY